MQNFSNLKREAQHLKEDNIRVELGKNASYHGLVIILRNQ